MNADEVRQAVMDVLTEIAPEAGEQALDPGADLREELDLDSMDFLNLVRGLHARLHVDIPEQDYADLVSIDAITAYLTR